MVTAVLETVLFFNLAYLLLSISNLSFSLSFLSELSVLLVSVNKMRTD